MILLEQRPRRGYSSANTSARCPADLPSVEEIFHRHAARLQNLARRVAGRDVDAEDVLQDVLVQVLRKLGSFRGEADLTTWLYRITLNAALAHRRKQARLRQRQLTVPLAALHEGAALRHPGGPDQQVLHGETREVVERAIGGLPDRYRDVYVLAERKELANAEIGRRLGLSLAAVKSRLHRARLLMRQALAFYF